jgi:hypothetical protein
MKLSLEAARTGALLVLLCSLLPVAAVRSADVAAEPSCTMGEAEAMLQALPIPIQVMRPRGLEEPKLLDTVGRCQYRLFRDGETFTFSEEDVFLGGVSYIDDFKQRGVTRREAVAELDAFQDRVWLAAVLPGGGVGEFAEQLLVRTTYKSHPGLPDESATVHLVIAPAGIAQ